ncbi:MAG: hypothetical protein IEMM0002_0467 [bacterium]|nr:MAG: hypothetical protein IEMM0002_0467 [bacterium]
MINKVFTMLALLAIAAPVHDASSQGEADSTNLLNIERRREQFPKDFSYFVYPIAGRIPGLGTAAGGGVTVTNIKETNVDVTGFHVDGDFRATGLAVLDVHLIPERLILYSGYYLFKVAPMQYSRGIDSSKDDYILPEAEGQVFVGQLTLSFRDRMFEVYTRYGHGVEKLNRVLDKNGNEFSNVDKNWRTFNVLNLGFTLDMTDDIQDPRKGIRMELVRAGILDTAGGNSSFNVYDYNLTAYVPVGRHNTWAFNIFFSDPVRQSAGTTDRDELRSELGLQCGSIPDPTARGECEAVENQYLDEWVASNRYGRATALGGTQRLRSYSNGRYYAGHSIFYGTEFRWNLTEERKLIDFFFFKGTRTNLQLAFFGGIGSVADSQGDLQNKMRSSYGVGFRVLFSGVTIRLDYAVGGEGGEMQLFFDYPWSMFSVDNPV